MSTIGKSANTGGRNKFPRGLKVRYITIQGSISAEEHLIDPNSEKDVIVADRKGLISIQNDNQKLLVQSRRIVPFDANHKSPVIETNNKYRTICNNCSNVLEITGSIESIDCEKCGKNLTLFWNGERPVTEILETRTDGQTAKITSNKSGKKMTETPKKFDMGELTNHKNFELWTKRSVKFDHVEVDVQAHVLLFTADNPRKLCFNTYDGSLGKKATSLPIDAFAKDEAITTEKKASHKPWFYVKDIEKARAQLKKNGYDQQ